ncbi:MAG: spondin domain-containing protein [Actinomycetota bacterium]
MSTTMFSKRVTKRGAAAVVGVASLVGTMAAVSPAAADSEDDRPAQIYRVTVEIDSRSPDNGSALTPFWVGVQDGNFDLYDRGAPLSPAMERIVEDGNIAPLIGDFAANATGEDAVVFGPGGPILPRDQASETFFVSVERGERAYFSYAAMVLPSNDAFVANGDPKAHLLIDRRGRTRQFRVEIKGGDVLDGGTEVNTEGPDDTAFLNQTGPDQGIDENGVVTVHPGFNPAQTDPFPNVLGTPRFANADFTRDGYRVANIRVRAERVRSHVSAELSGDNEVPAVDTNAGGLARLNIQEDGDLAFNVRAANIDNLLFGHIHLGAPGENGPVVATLFNGDISDGGLLRVRGELTDADLVGPLAGMSTADLWEIILDGGAYINIHSTDFPAGELRANLG